MGNGSSHSIVLGPPRFQSSDFRNGPYHPDHRGGVPKYAHPQNRVLPKPIAGQRLRSTDNGSILQTAGTIRGQQRRDSGGGKEEHIDPEMMGILRRRSEMIDQKENDCYHHLNLRNHRLFHSDPNIARRPSGGDLQESSTSRRSYNGGGGYANEDFQESYSNRRSCNGGAAVRASKLKYKKKARAPDPPPAMSSYPRRPQSSFDDSRKSPAANGLACKCISKPRAPQPPAIVIHPPPPPPMPGSSVTTRTKIGPSSGAEPSSARSRAGETSRSPPVTRAVECQGGKTTYEKNVHPLEKWRNCRSTGDIRIDEEDESPASRTTVFDSKKLSDNQSNIPSYLPQSPDPFQKEIQAVTKKIAESRQEAAPSPEDQKKTAKTTSEAAKPREPPPKFYFADPGVFKPKSLDKPAAVEKSSDVLPKPADYTRKDGRELKCSDNTTVDEVVPSLQRFSPARRRFKMQSGNSTPTPQQKAEKEWDHLSKSLFHKQDGDSDIDVRLRPVLPRKPPELPKFSPSEAWQALGSDGMASSNHSTSDDGPESFSAYNNKHLRNANDRPRRTDGDSYGHYDGFKHTSCSMSDSHWTPRQDLLDDSDVISDDSSEEAIVPRMRPGGLGEISTRFSLPSVMFSNMRPIGQASSTSVQPSSFLSDNATKVKGGKKKMSKQQNDPVYDNGPAPNFRRFLGGKKNKYVSEEDVTVSDSNWTFGQHGLQKRGKQYSSDLLLSDKKKYELMVQNHFGDFLGDILASNANHMRKQMKSSDSGNSNFSFYSTDGQIVYNPEKGGFVKEGECSPPTKGRVYDMRRRFESSIAAAESSSRFQNFGLLKSSKKKTSASDFDLSRRRDLELAKMLEDEVRKRRNKEKISIRQQLQRMKHLRSDDEEDFDDEAYFTEPKSRESPFFSPDRTTAVSELGLKPSRYFGQGMSVTATDSSSHHLSHWQSSPALLEDSMMKTNIHPSAKGRLSLSSVMSSPDSGAWVQSNGGDVDSWLKQQGLKKKLELDGRLTASDQANDGDVSSSPTPAPPPKKERRKTNIYKQLMDIVRKEERHLKKAQRGEPDSRDSSYSHRESSPSTCSESSSTSSYSYSDSSSAKNHSKNGVPANKEFGYRSTPSSAAPSFQVAFVQPYSPSKSYRPVPFDVVNSPYRLPGLQEEGKQLSTEVS